MYKYIDIHSHLNDPRFDADLPDVLLRMREGGIASIVVGTDRKMSERAIALAEQHPDLWATIGLHPTDNHKEEFDAGVYTKMAEHPRVVAIGECGLDYHWPEHDKWPSGMTEEKNRQRELFERQIAIALGTDKPLMIHGRPSKGSMDAYEDILAILKAHSGVRGNVHFFVGNIAIAKQFLDLGFTMSFTGVLSFSNDYDEVVRYIPRDSIMSETDAPYVAPTPHRGKRNEPLFVRETAAAIARIRGEEIEKTKEMLRANAQRSFMLC
jgi:TatD DNase family protein